MNNHTPTPADNDDTEDITIDIVILHGGPNPAILHALHTTGYTHTTTNPNHTTFTRVRPRPHQPNGEHHD